MREQRPDLGWKAPVVGLVLMALHVQSCTVSPMPQPPTFDPSVVRVFDLHMGIVILTAPAGTVDPPGASVTVYNLDSTEPPLTEQTDAEGGFSFELGGLPGDELRFHIRSDDAETIVDTVMQGWLQPAPRPLSDCLRAEPEMLATLRPSGQTSVRVVNDCAGAVDITSATMRVTPSPFVVTADETHLEPGFAISLTVEHQPDGSGLTEEVLIIELSGEQADRRPITLRLAE